MAARKPDRAQNLSLVSDVNFDSDSERVAFARHNYEIAQRERRRFEPSWMTCISYYLAKQWVEYDQNIHRISERPQEAHRVRYTENMFAPYVRNAIAQLTANAPATNVRPATADPEDGSVAKINAKLARSWWQSKALARETQEFLLWGKLTGNAFLRPAWDDLAGELLAEDDPEIVGDPPVTGTERPIATGGSPMGGRLAKFFEDVKRTVNAQAAGDKKPASNNRYIRLGDICFEMVSPFFVYPDPAGKDMRTVRWMIDARMRTLDWIRDRYPENGWKVVEESRYGRDKTSLASRVGDLYGGKSECEDVPSALVMTVYLAPSLDRPEGFVYTVANEMTLDGPKPLETRLSGQPIIPYFHFRDKIVPDQFWSASILDDAVQPQTLRNRAISQQLEAANLTGNPVVLNPVQSQMKKAHFVSAPGAVWNYSKLEAKPEYLAPPQYPQFAAQLPEVLRNGFENVVSQHEVSQGQAPPNTRTGVALAFLAEKDQASNSLAAEELRTCWSHGMACALELYADKCKDEKRVAKIVGKGDEYDFFEFTGRDLRSKNTNLPGAMAFDVDIDFLSQLPKSKAATQETVFRGLESGLIDVTNPEERQQAQKWIGFAMAEDDDTQRRDEAQQHVEIRLMMSTEDIDTAEVIATRINPWDNHAAHLAALDRTLKRPDALYWPPEVVARLVAHRQLHEGALRAQMMPAPGPGGARPGAPVAPAPGPVGGKMLSPFPGDPNSNIPPTAVTADHPRAT